MPRLSTSGKPREFLETFTIPPASAGGIFAFLTQERTKLNSINRSGKVVRKPSLGNVQRQYGIDKILATALAVVLLAGCGMSAVTTEPVLIQTPDETLACREESAMAPVLTIDDGSFALQDYLAAASVAEYKRLLYQASLENRFKLALFAY